MALIASLTQSTTWPTIDSRAARFSSALEAGEAVVHLRRQLAQREREEDQLRVERLEVGGAAENFLVVLVEVAEVRGDEQAPGGGGHADVLRQGLDRVAAEIGDPQVGALAQLLDLPADDRDLAAGKAAHVGVRERRHDVFGPRSALNDL